MKKTIILLVLLVIALSLTACSKTTPTNNDNEENDTDYNVDEDSEIRFGGEGVRERPNYDPDDYAVPKSKSEDKNEDDDTIDGEAEDVIDGETDYDKSADDDTAEADEIESSSPEESNELDEIEAEAVRTDKIDIVLEEITLTINELYGDFNSITEGRTLMAGADSLIFLLAQHMKELVETVYYGNDNLLSEFEAIKKEASKYFEI